MAPAGPVSNSFAVACRSCSFQCCTPGRAWRAWLRARHASRRHAPRVCAGDRGSRTCAWGGGD
eukprot:4541045-Alexandrium_andersonii.AAC.1